MEEELMKYFNENMSPDDARKKMFLLTEKMRDDKKTSDEIWDEYVGIRPILRKKERASKDYMNMLTS
jgi:hypothetical protein